MVRRTTTRRGWMLERVMPGFLGLACLASTPAQAEPFVFVSLPDTQVYTENRFPDPPRTPAVTEPEGTLKFFFDQTEWIAEYADELGIRYVGHLGDIVQNGNNLDEWDRAKAAMDILLDADIPHGTVMGNHDDNHGPDYARNYLDHFGPQFYQDRDWYTGSSPMGPPPLTSSGPGTPPGTANWQLLEHDGYKIGFLNLSIDHPQSDVDWATQVVENNPDTIFVIGTHRYLYDFKVAGGRYGEDVSTAFDVLLGGPINIGNDDFIGGVADGNDAEALFTDFISQHPNILMIHAGHFHAEWLRLDGLNGAAKTIIQILTDYQSTRNGGDGYLRLYEFDFEADEFRFRTYSPSLDRERTVMDHFVETIYLVYDQRGQIKDVLGPPFDDDAVYFPLVFGLFKPFKPDGFLLEHPDFDEPHERAYYETYLSELFHGNIPAGFENIADWENLWLMAFAADPDNARDFRDWVRSPNGVVDVDFSEYFTPSTEQQLYWAFEELEDQMSELGRNDLLFRFAGYYLAWGVDSARRLADAGRHRAAERLLERSVLPFLDGCAERGRPDTWWNRWRRLDLITSCDAQQRVHTPASEVVSLLAQLRTAP